jgi:hypothetical protein
VLDEAVHAIEELLIRALDGQEGVDEIGDLLL